MSHTEILKILRAFKKNCAEQYGIIALGLFGSAARDESQADSDVDIVIKLKKQDLFNTTAQCRLKKLDCVCR